MKKLSLIINIVFAVILLLSAAFVIYMKTPINSDISKDITREADFRIVAVPKEKMRNLSFLSAPVANKMELTFKQREMVYDFVRDCEAMPKVSKDTYEYRMDSQHDAIGIMFADLERKNLYVSMSSSTFFYDFPDKGFAIKMDKEAFAKSHESLYKAVTKG